MSENFFPAMLDRSASFFVAGHRGLVGSAIWRQLSGAGFEKLVGRTSSELDLRDREAVFAFFSDVDISLIPNFAEGPGPIETHESDDWVYVGRLVAEKGLAWLLEHWPGNRRLTIVGSGPLANEAAAAAIRHPGRIRFLGQLPPLETRREIANAKGLVLPSLWSEGIPTVALEALQSGTPVLISDQCASADELTKGGAGRVFNIKSGKLPLTEALSSIDADPQIRGRALRAYRERYSEAAWINQVEQVYGRIRDSDRSRGSE